MHRSVLFFLSLICHALVFATSVNVKTFMLNGKEAYLLEAGAFPHENNALQLKFKLSSLFKNPVKIDFVKDKNLYLVTLGPVYSLQEATTIQSQLNNSLALKVLPLNKPKLQSNSLNNEEILAGQEVTLELETDDRNGAQAQHVLNKESNADHSSLTIDNTNKAAPKKLWNLRNADIRAVIAEVSRVTGMNFVIDPRVQGKISIVSSTPISDKELYQVFLSMLQVSGYAAIQFGDVTKIIPNIDAKVVSTYQSHHPFNSLEGDEMMVEVVPVRYVPAEQLVPVLRPLMPQWSSISAYEPSNMLILSGRANNIRRLSSIIKQVDSSTSNGIDIVPLRHALAMDVAATLKDLVKSPASAQGRNSATLAADDRSNSILISGTRTDRIRFRILIEKLDRRSPNNGSNSTTQVVYLHYLRAEDLAPILAGVAQANFSGNVGITIGTVTKPTLDSTNPASSIVGDSSSGSGTGVATAPSPAAASPDATANTTGASTQNEGTTKPTVQIIAEPNTNSIILNAPASIIRILRGVIAQLDIKPAQILIEAMIAEVSESDIRDLGVEWGAQYGTGAFVNGFAIISTKLNVDDFQARIRLLVEQRKANVLSTPSVMVLDNRQAKILVGKQVSVGSTTYPNNAGGTATASPYTTFSRVNVALHLYVRPQITNGEGIQMQIDQGNDTIDAASLNDTTNPVFRVSSIVTSVQIESGDLVVLGGLTQDSLGNDDNRLGILGDIPGIGRLFQHKIRNREKRVLMVFIRPIILKTERDTVGLSGGKYNDLRKYQMDLLRTQEFNETNRDILLPPLKQETLPRPFLRPTLNIDVPANMQTK